MASVMKNEEPRKNHWRIAMWSAAALLLLLPLLAMQFTSEVVWTLSDFVTFGVMLAVACGCYELAVRMTVNKKYRLAVGVAIAVAFLLLWAELAVGIFD